MDIVALKALAGFTIRSLFWLGLFCSRYGSEEIPVCLYENNKSLLTLAIFPMWHGSDSPRHRQFGRRSAERNRAQSRKRRERDSLRTISTLFCVLHFLSKTPLLEYVDAPW